MEWNSVVTIDGVDLLDCALSDLRIVTCGKKRYWPLVINAINNEFVYSWRLYRILSSETIPQKIFRRYIVVFMIRQSKPRIISVGSHLTKAHTMADEGRYDRLGHYPISSSVWKSAIWDKNCRNSCEKWKRSLHVKLCFQNFHEKLQYDDIITPTFIIFII